MQLGEIVEIGLILHIKFHCKCEVVDSPLRGWTLGFVSQVLHLGTCATPITTIQMVIV